MSTGSIGSKIQKRLGPPRGADIKSWPPIVKAIACRGFRTTKCLDDFMTVCLWHNSTWYNANPKIPKMQGAPQFQETMSESISEHDAPENSIFKEMYNSICSNAFPQVRTPFVWTAVRSRHLSSNGYFLCEAQRIGSATFTSLYMNLNISYWTVSNMPFATQSLLHAEQSCSSN
jgi:hypothetical protein